MLAGQRDQIVVRDESAADYRLVIKGKNRGGRLATQKALKGYIDLFGAGFLIVVLLPIFLILSLVILWDDGRPVIYRRRVMGRKDEFDALKFRSMRRDADAVLAGDAALEKEFQRHFKLKDDPRLTRVGSFLRKFSLDELPQMFNVLRGQMSLVGPRMITRAELDKYGPYAELLRSVKPGLTGYWQVHGRQDVSYEERVKMDINYIENWSIWMDLKILVLTPFRVIMGKGAY